MQKLTKNFFDKFLEKNIEIVPINLYTFKNNNNIYKKGANFYDVKWKKEFNKDIDFEANDFNSYAIRTGKINNLTVIDIDTKDEEICNKVIEHLGMGCFGDFNTVVETKNGYHIYCKYNESLPTGTKYKKDFFNFAGIDIRNDGGLIYAPFSQYKDENGKVHEYKLYGSNYELEDFVDDLCNYDDLYEIPQNFLLPKTKKITDFKDETKTIQKKDVEKIESNIKIDMDINKIKSYLHKLNIERLDDYDDWIKIGMILFNISNGSLEYLNLFDEISKKSNKYIEGECLKKWSSFKKNDLSIGTLIYWVKEDNKPIYDVKKDDENYNKYNDWYIQGIDIFMENMNKELMRTKNNEFIQLEKDNKHFIHKKTDAVDEYAKYSFFYRCILSGKDKVLNPFTIWLNHTSRRDVFAIKFDPTEKEDKNYFNIYKGFNYKLTNNIDYNKIEPFLFHIKDVWANNNEKHYNYILNWFSHIFQKPNKKTLTAIVATGIEGNGKSIIINKISELMGDLAYSTANIESIIGSFNPLSEGRLLINLNECTWAGKKSQEGILKELITDDKRIINNKNIKPYTIENYSNIIITSNEENPVPIGNTNRRYFFLEMKEEKLTKDKFKKIDNIDNQILFNYFMNRDITDFNPQDFEHTEKETSQKEFNQPTYISYWLEVLQDGEISTREKKYDFESLKDLNYKIEKDFLYKSYEEKNYGYSQKISRNSFFKKTKEMFNAKLINADKYNRARIELGELTFMRELFDKYNNSNYFC